MTFKDLDTKQKIQFIWDYYKLPIIGTILGVIAACSLIYTMFIRVPDTNFCGVAIYGQFLSALDTDKLTQQMNTALQLPEHNSVQIMDFYTDSTDVTVEADLNQKFNTYVYALEIHTIVSNATNIKTFASVEYLSPITDYVPAEKVQQLRDKGMLLEAEDPETKEMKPYGISLSGSKILKEYHLFQEEDEGDKPFLAFVPIQDNTENTLKVVDLLLAE